MPEERSPLAVMTAMISSQERSMRASTSAGLRRASRPALLRILALASARLDSSSAFHSSTSRSPLRSRYSSSISIWSRLMRPASTERRSCLRLALRKMARNSVTKAAPRRSQRKASGISNQDEGTRRPTRPRDARREKSTKVSEASVAPTGTGSALGPEPHSSATLAERSLPPQAGAPKRSPASPTGTTSSPSAMRPSAARRSRRPERETKNTALPR